MGPEHHTCARCGTELMPHKRRVQPCELCRKTLQERLAAFTANAIRYRRRASIQTVAYTRDYWDACAQMAAKRAEAIQAELDEGAPP